MAIVRTERGSRECACKISRRRVSRETIFARARVFFTRVELCAYNIFFGRLFLSQSQVLIKNWNVFLTFKRLNRKSQTVTIGQLFPFVLFNFPKVLVSGTSPNLFINVFYSLSRTVLIVKLIKGEEFPQYAGDSPNVFLELKLVPAMKKDILKTDIHERNANPNLNEAFEFGLPYDVVKKQNLSFTLMYMDKFSHPFPVGELTHHLDHLEMVGSGTVREEMIVCREIQRLQQVRSE